MGLAMPAVCAPIIATTVSGSSGSSIDTDVPGVTPRSRNRFAACVTRRKSSRKLTSRVGSSGKP